MTLLAGYRPNVKNRSEDHKDLKFKAFTYLSPYPGENS